MIRAATVLVDVEFFTGGGVAATLDDKSETASSGTKMALRTSCSMLASDEPTR